MTKTISAHIGENVSRLREMQGLTQSDLESQLSTPETKWTRTAVGMLESRGIRGERISDLVELCIALDQPLVELLKGDGSVVLQDGTQHSLATIRRALFEPRQPREPATSKPPLKVGEEDPRESARLAKSLDVSDDDVMYDYLTKLFRRPPSLTIYRDFLGLVTDEDTREEARRKRIRGTRRLRSKVAELDRDPSPEELEEAEAWLRTVTAYRQLLREDGREL